MLQGIHYQLQDLAHQPSLHLESKDLDSLVLILVSTLLIFSFSCISKGVQSSLSQPISQSGGPPTFFWSYTLLQFYAEDIYIHTAPAGAIIAIHSLFFKDFLLILYLC